MSGKKIIAGLKDVLSGRFKATRFRVERAVNSRGWSRWVNPAMRGYRMACCDCGLVHEMQFRVIEKGKTRKDDSYRFRPLRKPELAVSFRAKRAFKIKRTED